VPLLRRAVELRPTLARAWSRLGAAQQALGHDVEALDSYSRALAVEPADVGTREARDRLRAELAGHGGQTDGAEEPATEGRR
jgi:Flp pilus assembly protein TadD